MTNNYQTAYSFADSLLVGLKYMMWVTAAWDNRKHSSVTLGR